MGWSLLLFGSPAFAIDLGQWVPGLSLRPFISENVEYDSNVFQVPVRAQDDVIFKTIPGLLVEYTLGPASVSTGYRVEILRFLDLETQNTEHHIAAGQFRLELPRLLVNLRDDYTLTSDPPGTELTGRIESTTNVLAPEAEYRLTERFSVGANYSWTNVDFKESAEELDRNEHLVGGSVFWKFLPKTDLRLNYSYGLKDFDADRDATRNIVTLGLRGDLTAKLSSTFRIGFEDRQPDRTGQKDFSSVVMGGDWVYKPTERTTLTLVTDRSAQESSFGSTVFYVATNATVQVTQEFGPKLSANLVLTGGVNDYPTKETVAGRAKFRNDMLFRWGAGVKYDIQPWLQVGTEYSHSRRDSNFDDFDFEGDKISGRISLQF